MSISAIEFVLLGVASFVTSGLLTWPVRKLAIWVGAMDKPTMERKTQVEPVPYLGGVSIALTVCLIAYASIIYSDNTKTTFPLVTYLLLPAVFMGAMGLVDDLRGLQPMPRLIFQTLVAVVVSIVLIQTETIGTPLDNTFIVQIIVVLWIVGLCNSINFFDNLDGGAAGTVAVSTLGITLIAFAQGQELIAALAVVTAGATIGFLLWNKSPAKIYMGDAGALFLGAYTPEPMGDYIAGPNHVLPTAGTARFSSALSVEHFTKKISLIHYSETAFQKEADDVIRLAQTEGLGAHANSVKIRKTE